MYKISEAPGRPRSNAGSTANIGNGIDRSKPYTVTIQNVALIVSPKYSTAISRILVGRIMKHKTKMLGIRGMKPNRALARCAKITSAEWLGLEVFDTIDLWKVFREYILNDYQDANILILPQLVDVWERCKVIIDKEVRG